ncbi:Clavaminate synthase-like protein [Meira miltonrushii]|uniref:Clavaminate synthase-like protein n=1 Tax=Meira miltonrushii TaxID=1280837 RepID=A0A316VJ43_9BASI|nr:Clavaminate synthase-like protein [Meira miltonrushii]PWN37566.1 Clavaminate synthase-like protein [Meira miltonrushii]
MDQGTTSSRLTIEKLDKLCSYDEFLDQYLIPNKPCILPFELVKEWPAFKEWLPALDGNDDREADDFLDPAFAILATRYGNHEVPIVIENLREEEDSEDRFERQEVHLSQAVAMMAEAKKTGNARIYIKDWHMIRQERMLRSDTNEPYTTPSLFADDWMNNVKSEADDDFRFCYAGSAGTRTVIHRDVYTSYSWSTNIVGKKIWRLFPPTAKTHLRQFPQNANSELARGVEEMEKHRTAGKLKAISTGGVGWPEWKKAMDQCHEVVQESGETIFVPSDWHHEVINLTDCISLNHNWCNSCNIKSMYKSMCEEVEKTEEAISDVRQMMQESDPLKWQIEWTETVQRIVAANAGWAWEGFWDMVLQNLENPPCEVSTIKS